MNDLSFVLVIFFVTLGPIKVIAAFAQLTSQLPDGERRALALRSTLIATAVGFLILFIGDNLRQNWQIASPDLLLTGGVLLLIGALERSRMRSMPLRPMRRRPRPRGWPCRR